METTALKRLYRSLFLAILIISLPVRSFAQSSVTLFGSVDDGITYVNNVGGKSLVGLSDGIQRSNKLGFQGTEDLGGGTKAIFTLVNGFSLNNGTTSPSGSMFKEAWAGLSNTTYGSLTLGRQYDLMSDLVKYFACLECGAYVVTNTDADHSNGDYMSNVVKYRTPGDHELGAAAMYAFGSRDSGYTASGRTIGLEGSYAHGPFAATLVYLDINGMPFSASTMGVPTVLGVNVAKTPSFDLTNDQIFAAGVSYKIGKATIDALYSNARLKLSSVAATDQAARLGATYLVRPDALVSFMETFEHFEGQSWWTTSSGFSYFFSKATRAYLDVEYQKSSDAAVASIRRIGPSSAQTQLLLRVGLIHTF
ncbi:porin [Paraburkholderia acidisoli]|uniref:Porin n=1 Tax=Paraburkholderia acidisoli TaxID=2571748 RepID=A0A7Z2JL56_9BURK|nr:porin [Paraburkholderia acidisoli]QGZ67029.1 porin [Paraburkholderia acidisoli]